MPSEMPDRWVLLQMRRAATDPSVVWMSYLDDGATRRNLPHAGAEGADWAVANLRLDAGGEWMRVQLRYPSDLLSLVLERAGSLPYRWIDVDNKNATVPLPIFIVPPDDAWDIGWEYGFQNQLLRPVPRERYEFVRMVPGRRRRPPPFRLPLRILTTGSDAWTKGVVTDLKRTSWFRNRRVKKHGMALEHVSPDEILDACHDPPDILVVEDLCWADVRPKLDRLTPSRSPRLVVRMDKPLGGGFELWRPTPGVAFIEGPDEARFLKELVLAIVHDQALHEAAATAQRALASLPDRYPAPAPRLLASPESNQSLRMADAFAAIVEETLKLEGDLLVSGPESPPRLPARPEAFAAAQMESLPIRKALEKGQKLVQDFRRESFGLIPLAKANARLLKARAARAKVAKTMAKVAEDPKTLDKLRRNQRRKVDVSLFRTEYSPLLDPRLGTERGTIWVEGNSALRRGAVYRLRVHVGQATRTSVVVGEVASVEPLLAERKDQQEGHQLEVAVFGLDFTLRSPRIQKIYLPPLGSSDFAHILVRAPRRLGPAHLRIVIYHENHVLQSFLLTAQVAREEFTRAGDPLLKVEQAFSRSERFTNLDALSPRLLSIGTNRAGDNHHVMIKGSAGGAEFDISSKVLTATESEFRTLLHAAAFKNGLPTFPTYPSDGASYEEEFGSHLRALARFGHGLYKHVFEKFDPGVEPLLIQIKKCDDETIQVVRYDDDHAYPWDVFYDFELPKDLNAAVCPGFSIADDDRKLVPCDHVFDSRVYCGRGFLGVRHRLESMLGGQEEADKTVSRPQGALVRVATGLADAFIVRAEAELADHLNADQVVRISETENIYDVLHQDGLRPAIAIIHGHSQVDENGIAIELLAQPGRLTADEIHRLRSRAEKPWEQPRPLVLLIACDSNAFDTQTLTDFVRSFLKAGALGVVGTNCQLTSALGSRFASDVVRSLFATEACNLGEAVAAFRRQLLAEGNPLGFVFTFYGDADLAIEK